MSRVKIEVFDLFGRRIKTLTDREWAPGYQTLQWDCTSDNGARVHAGVYTYRLIAPSFRQQKKMVLIAR